MTKEELKTLIRECIKEVKETPPPGSRKGVVHVGDKSIIITLIPKKYHFGTRWIAINDTYPPPQIQILYPTPQKAFLTHFKELQYLSKHS